MTQLEPPFEVHWQSPPKHIQNLEKLHQLRANTLNIHKWNKNAPSVSSYNYHLLYLNSYFMFHRTSKHLDMCLSPLTALLSLSDCMFTGCAAEDRSSDTQWVTCAGPCQQTVAEEHSDRQKQRLCVTETNCAKPYLIHSVCNSTSAHSMSLPPHFRLA